MPISDLSPYRQPLAQLGTLKFDGLITEHHAMRAEVTDHAMESGANVNDHIRNLPRRITVEGKITNAPLRVVSGIRSALEGASKNYAQTAFTYLENLFINKELVNVIGKYRTYESMAIQSLDIPRDSALGDALRVQVELKEVRKIEIRSLGFRFPRTKFESAQPQQNAGNKVTAAASAKVEEKSKTVLAAIADLVF